LVDADADVGEEFGADLLSNPSICLAELFDAEGEEVDNSFHNNLDIAVAAVVAVAAVAVAVAAVAQEGEEWAFLLLEVAVMAVAFARNHQENSKDHLPNLLHHFSFHLLHLLSQLK
jgi:hypothetical protein